jgi:hypothetical protein
MCSLILPSRVSARPPSYFWHCPKVTKRLAPAPRFILRCSQRAGRKQIARWRASMRAVGSWVFVYDRPLLRSSARAEGARKASSDRCTMEEKPRTRFACPVCACSSRPIGPSRTVRRRAVQAPSSAHTGDALTAHSCDVVEARATRALEETGGPLRLASLPTFGAIPESRSAAGPKPGEVASYARS